MSVVHSSAVIVPFATNKVFKGHLPVDPSSFACLHAIGCGGLPWDTGWLVVPCHLPIPAWLPTATGELPLIHCHSKLVPHHRQEGSSTDRLTKVEYVDGGKSLCLVQHAYAHVAPVNHIAPHHVNLGYRAREEWLLARILLHLKQSSLWSGVGLEAEDHVPEGGRCHADSECLHNPICDELLRCNDPRPKVSHRPKQVGGDYTALLYFNSLAKKENRCSM